MMNMRLWEALAFTLPVVGALVCMLMMLMDVFRYKRDGADRRLRLLLALTYLATSLGWIGMVLFSISSRAFEQYHIVFQLTLMMDQVMFFWVVSIITGTGERWEFNFLHLVVPVAFTAISFVGDLVLPAGKLGTVRPEDAEAWFRAIYLLTTLIFVIYNTLYPLLNLLSIRRYRRFIVNYSSEAQRISLDWLTVMQVLILITVPVPLAGLLLDIQTFSTSYLIWLGALPTFVFYVMLCYNLLDDNYLIIQPEPFGEDIMPARSATIDRKRFERYLRDKKPYLNPNLRITDLAAGLNTNRSYLSAFINREYGMNFCRLINRCRLDALHRLRLSPEYAGKTNMELVLIAGFSGYRNYLRVKREEDRLSELKIFE